MVWHIRVCPVAAFIPKRLPNSSKSGPPELPVNILASCCIVSGVALSVFDNIPPVIAYGRPLGCPSA